MGNKFRGKINPKNTLKGKLNNFTKYISPPLIDLEITPTTEEQIFNHEGEFGYDVVTVKKIEDNDLVAENIKDGVEILGITGNFVGKKYAPKYILFRDCTETDLTEEISNLDTKNITSMENMFYSCKNVTSLDLSGWDTSNVTIMKSMFYDCLNATEIDVSNIDTSNVASMKSMFWNCNKITSLDVSNWNISNIEGEFSSVFGNCKALETLDLSKWKLSNITSVNSTFYNCSKLSELDLRGFDVSNVTNASSCFSGCSALTTLNIEGWDTSKITSAGNMFHSCKFSSLPQLDASSMTYISNMFSSCSNLTDFGGLKDLGKAYLTTKSANNTDYVLYLNSCTKLTHDSLMNVINNLYDIKSAGVQEQKLVLGATNLAKLTEEEIAIATNKGWTVS